MNIRPLLSTSLVCCSCGLAIAQTPPAPPEPPAAAAATEAPTAAPETEAEHTIVVTGTRRAQRAADAPVRVQVVGPEKLARRQVTTLADALSNTTGVRVETNCQNCGFTQVRLNGLEGRYSQILIDGRPVFSSVAGVYGLEQIPEEMIEQIEIVKGGGSALYGGSAVAGVINVVTARPRKSYGRVDARWTQTGDAAGQRLTFDVGQVNEAKSLRLHAFGGLDQRDRWDANGDDFSELGALQQVTAGTELYQRPFAGSEIALKFHALREDRRGGSDFDQVPHRARVAEAIETQRLGAEARFKHSVTALWDYEVGYAFAATDRDSYYGAGGAAELPARPGPGGSATDWSEYDAAAAARELARQAYGVTENRTHVADWLNRFSFMAGGEHIVTAGAELWADELNDRAPAYGRSIDALYWDAAALLQHEWFFADWGESVVGARVDQHSQLDDPVVSPRLALRLRPAPGLTLRTSVASGFRAPQVFDEDLHITIVNGEGQVIRNAAGLDPERSWSLAQQVRYERPAGRWTWAVGANGFATWIDQAFDLREVDDPATANELEFERFNRGTNRVYGAELEASVRRGSDLGAELGWTVEQAESDTPHPDFDTTRLLRTPQHYGFAELWGNWRGLRAATALEITGPMRVGHFLDPGACGCRVDGSDNPRRLETSPWFFDVSVNLAWRLPLADRQYVEPYLSLRNLLDSRQTDFDVGEQRDAGYVYGPRAPRAAVAGLRAGI